MSTMNTRKIVIDVSDANAYAAPVEVEDDTFYIGPMEKVEQVIILDGKRLLASGNGYSYFDCVCVSIYGKTFTATKLLKRLKLARTSNLEKT